MFASCSSLTNLDLSNFNTQNVTDMTRMITGCSNLKTLHLSNKFIISTTYTDDVFGSTNNLNSIIVVGANPVASQFTKVKTQLPNSTFYVPDKIAYEEAWSGDFSGDRIKPILEMLGNENVVRYADEPYEEEGYTVAEINIANSGDYIKCGYNVTISGDVNTTVAGKYTIEYILTKTFTKGTKTVTEEVMRAPRILEVIGIEPYMITEWTTPSANTTIKLPVQGTGLNITVNWGDDSAEQTVTTSFPTHTYAKAGTYKIKVVGTCPKWGYASGSTVSTTSNYYTYTQYLTKVKQFGELGAQQYGFAQCKNLTEVSGDNLVTNRTFEKTTSMASMFYNCSKLTSLDVSKFDTSKVTNMSYMFSRCGLISLDISNFNTFKVTDMSYMFGARSVNNEVSSGIKEIKGLENINTSNVISMMGMFQCCAELEYIDVSNFDTSKVTNMSWMFDGCLRLTTLDVSKFDTSKVTDMSMMFYACGRLTNLDVNNFNTSKVTNMKTMFGSCYSLKTLQLSNKFFIPASNNTDMFKSTTNLTSIILVDSTPLAGQFTNIKSQLDGKKFYVPSKSAETAYETSWVADFTADRIQPILELVGDENVTIKTGETYTDAGYTVAGFDKTNSGDYTVYGYNVTTSGDVNTAVAGTYKIDYTITRTYNNAGVAQTDTLMSVERTVTVEVNEKSKMITEWTIPAANTTIKLPVQGTGLNITVDWGDGTAEQTVTTSFPTHTYATAGTYEIKVWGTCPKWGYASFNTVSSTSNSDYYTYTQYLTKVKQFGELGAQQYGFAQCENLTEVSGDNLVTNRTFEKTTSMSHMFSSCSNLTSLDVSKFNTSNVTTMSGMFSSCSNLTSLDVSKFNTSNVTTMSGMFSSCSNLTSLDVSKFNTSKVTDMSGMFYNCSNLTSLDVSGFDTSKVTDMSGMFSFCSNLTSLDVSGFDTSNVTNMSHMFSDCSKLTSLDVSGFDTANVTSISEMFYFCSNLTSLDVSGFDTSKVTNMSSMFRNCSNLTSLDVSKFNTSNVTSMLYMFCGCSNLTSLDVSRFDTSKVTNMWAMFYNCSKLTSLDVSKFNTSNVTNMTSMFRNCSSLTSLDVSGFDTSKVIYMSGMFSFCSNLTSLDVSGFDTSKVTIMSGMFYKCSKLTSLDVSRFDTSKVTNLSMMFSSCSNLTSLDVSGFDTSKVTNMRYMFSDCVGLSSLDVSKFDTSKVTDMSDMFDNCTNLKSLQLSNKFKIPTSDIADMFTNTINLKSIIIVDSEPLASQFTPVKSQLTGKTFYVPNKVAETAYEESWSGDFSGDRIQPILELLGKENITLNVGETYTDAGYTVAGFDKTNSGDYTVYGYNVTTSGEVNTAVAGTYKIDYTITRTYNNAGVAQTDTLMTVTRSITVKEVIKETSKMITEWTIPAANTTIKLPVQGTGLKITVDWGDGTAEQTVTTAFPTHIYATAGTYEIKVWGTCPHWGDASSSTVSTTSNYYTYTQYLTKVKQFGELGAQQYGFAQCKNLTEVSGNNLVTSKTFENVTDMADMFYNCSNLTSLDVSGFDTSKVTNMSAMFYSCSNLTSLDVSGFDTSNVTTMSYMFDRCSNLTSLNVSGFDTSNVSTMLAMFQDCSGLTSLDVSGFDTSKVTKMSSMFNSCSNLTSLDVSGFDTSNVTTMSSMFGSCRNLTSLNVSGFDTSNVTTMGGMFDRCRNLTSLNVSGFDTSNVTDMSGMFQSCSGLTSLDVSGFDTSNVTTMGGMFSTCRNLTSLNVSGFDTSKVTNMSGMFSDCSKLTSLDVSGFDTAKVTKMSSMFNRCSNLTSLDVSEFDTAKVTDMSLMFYYCSNLTSLDVSGFDTSNVRSMYSMFQNCSGLTSLDLSNFNTSKVTDMSSMFDRCSNLTSLDVSGFDTSKVTYMSYMFYNCTKLKSLQLSNKFKTPTSNTTKMFTNTTNLTSIILVDSTPLAGQFTNIKSQLDSKKFYVPNKVAETAYEESWSGDFTADRIQTILELVGDENVTIKAGETYTDAGYTVAGFDKTNSGDYTVYGYNVTTSGEVNTAVAGKYTIEYILTRTHSNGTGTVTEEIMKATRTVEVIDTASYMITEWNVSGDVGLTITLPVSGAGLNITVDWGDGSAIETITTEFPTHAYATTGIYEISVLGNCPEWGYKESTSIGNQSKYYTYTQYLIGIKQWGELNATRYGFSKCINLKYVHGNATANTFLKLNDMTRMFCDCKSLQELDLSFINSSNVTWMHGVFEGCTNLKSINLDTLNTNKVNDMSNMFSGCNSLKDLDLKSFDTSNVKYMNTMFYDCKSLTKLDISNFVTNNVVGMTGMFKQCRNLVELNLTSIDTSNVTSMFQMFNACNSLKELDLSDFNTSKVTSTNDMFYDCRSLEKLDISNFDTSNVTDMYDMFCSCKSLKEIDVSSFDTSKVDNMMSMFANCSSLERLNISNFNTSNVTAMNGMFRGCSKVETLNLKNIELANVKSMNEMFAGCTKLKSILTSEKFVISGDTTDMFNNCPNLTAIITTSTTPVANQFKGQLPAGTKLYVPNGCEDAYKEILSGDTDASKIKPIIEPIGETEVGMLVGTSYEEQNYTVAGFGIEDAKYYMAYGYDVKVSGDVNTNECGTYKIEYILTRTYTDENGVQKKERHIATRIVKVYDAPVVNLYENNVPYSGDWTNQDVVAIMNILSPKTTWVSVKVENGDWTEEPSYADIVKSGEQMIVTFHESLNGKVYFKEVDVTGNATTYQSEPSIIKIDKEKPVVQDMTAKTIDGVIKLEAKVFDSLSGIEKYSIMQSGETQISWKEYDRTDGKIEEILPSSGTYYLWLKDVAGNVSSGDYMNVIKDVEAPKGTIDIIPTNVVSGDKYTNQDTVLINLNVTDNQTEQARIMYALYNEEDYEQVKAGTKEIEWKQYIPTVTWTLKEPQGINIIYAVFKDTAGNVTITKGAAVQKP